MVDYQLPKKIKKELEETIDLCFESEVSYVNDLLKNQLKERDLKEILSIEFNPTLIKQELQRPSEEFYKEIEDLFMIKWITNFYIRLIIIKNLRTSELIDFIGESRRYTLQIKTKVNITNISMKRKELVEQWFDFFKPTPIYSDYPTFDMIRDNLGYRTWDEFGRDMVYLKKPQEGGMDWSKLTLDRYASKFVEYQELQMTKSNNQKENFPTYTSLADRIQKDQIEIQKKFKSIKNTQKLAIDEAMEKYEIMGETPNIKSIRNALNRSPK